MQPNCMNCGRCFQESQRIGRGQLDVITLTCLQDGLQKGAGDKACLFWIGKEKRGLRPIHFGHKDYKEKVDVYDGIGWFHQWVTESEEVEGGSLHETFALIELEDGTMKYAQTNYVQFADTGAVRTICVQEEVVPPQSSSAQGSVQCAKCPSDYCVVSLGQECPLKGVSEDVN